eukprot:TRINITY_DN39534_c0_g1_i1.p1 TRINITY_DN39534_c0_g1~~TRINITY_DN39534_c0_g1_i1.p1  ORF type:complete len:372 (+),score=51.01 TRINITY_DN39534_c0_g1_i1:204-1319(+)
MIPRRALLLVSTFLTAHALFHCASDMECSLNGVCSAGSCACDSPWTGVRCGNMITAPAAPGGIYGFAPNVSSWGGNVLKGDDGDFHLFVAEIPGGLRAWGDASRCTHAVAKSIQGPYLKHDESLPAECHNPIAIREQGTGQYLLFHIGSGNGSGSSFMHRSASPTGPWIPATVSPTACNNPAPAYHPNGTLYVICNHVEITNAVTQAGVIVSWTALRKIGSPGPQSRSGNYEDPFLWFDRRGNWHIIYHVFCLDPFDAHNECTSGHAFSEDGLSWVFGADEPFDGTVQFSDRTNTSFSTRERPHFLFRDEAKTTPMAVITGVSSQPVDAACAGCNSHACSQCKVTVGRDWTFTQMQPFEGFAEQLVETGGQ